MYLLQGDMFMVNCPHCGKETKAVCITPGAQSVICTSCNKAVRRERILSFLRSGLFDSEDDEG